MASTITITHDKLARLVGTLKSPLVIDVRKDEDFAAEQPIFVAIDWHAVHREE